MTQRLFDIDSYIKEFTATVLSSVYEDGVYKTILDKTAFFPEGGGQLSDKGTLNGVLVFDVQEQDGIIYHYTRSPIPEGEVTGIIHWDERFYKMQNHTAEHIISGIVFKRFGYSNSGFHLGSNDEYMTMDYNGIITQAEADAIEREANEAIAKGLPVKAWYPDDLSVHSYRSKLDLTENVRLVEIEGIDTCACCAPHLKSTSEAGMVKIISLQKFKGGVRITAKAGFYAYNEFCLWQSQLKEISSLLSLPFSALSDGVKKKLDAIDALRYELTGLKRELLSLRPAEARCIFVDSPDLMKDAVNILKNSFPDQSVGAFCGNDEDGYRFMILSDGDMDEIRSVLRASGGGRDGMLQGKCTASKKEIEHFFN